MATAGDEPVEVVDEQGHVLEVVPRRQMRAERLRHRAVFVAVRSPDGRLLVHRRSDDKDVWPGWWDLAVGGVVGVDEPWDDAAARELAEEVGVVVVPRPLDGGRLSTYDDDQVSLVGRCYQVVTDGPFRFADGEVVEARLVDADELAALMAAHPFLPDSVALLLPLLQGLRPHTA